MSFWYMCYVWSNISLLDECLHEKYLISFAQQLFDAKRFKTIEYPLKDEKIYLSDFQNIIIVNDRDK